MRACELVQRIYDDAHYVMNGWTCDTLTAGDPDREVRKIAITMMPTAAVIRAAVDWGADLMIEHEPLYGEHDGSKAENDPVYAAKDKMLQDSGLTAYRYHDYCHRHTPDHICAGEIHYLGLKGTVRNVAYGVNRMVLDEPVTPRQLAARMVERLGVAHPRIAGDPDSPMTKLSLYFGAAGDTRTELQSGEVEMVLVGEVCEWRDCEYARDAAFFGQKKAIIAMGHVGSERDGMKLFADELAQAYPELSVRYFDCGEVYTVI